MNHRDPPRNHLLEMLDTPINAMVALSAMTLYSLTGILHPNSYLDTSPSHPSVACEYNPRDKIRNC